MNDLPQLFQFFGLWQIVIGIFSFVALISVWNYITKENDLLKKDYGLLYLSLAVLVWAFSGMVEIFYARSLEAHLLENSSVDGFDKTSFEGMRSILSILNSAFILLALPCFKHIPKNINGILQSEAWKWLVGITFLLSALFTAFMLIGITTPVRPTFINSVDSVYGVFTLFFLGYILWASFEKRQLRVLAWLSVLCIAYTLIAQVLKVFETDFWRIFFSCTFKTMLILLFFALVMSWIKELSKTYIPKTNEMFALFEKKKNGNNKFEYSVLLTIPPHIQMKKVSFTEKNYALFLKFAQRKVENKNGGWLEIQPKTKALQHKDYDLKDYNEISRILDSILNTAYGTGNWNKEDERKALKEMLFEYDNRKIRLKVLGEHISFS